MLEFASPAADAEAAERAVLSRLARRLREERLAAGLAHRVATQPSTKRAVRRRSGPPKQKVLYLPAFLASVSLPHSKVEGSEFSRVNGDIRLSLLAPER